MTPGDQEPGLDGPVPDVDEQATDVEECGEGAETRDEVAGAADDRGEAEGAAEQRESGARPPWSGTRDHPGRSPTTGGHGPATMVDHPDVEQIRRRHDAGEPWTRLAAEAGRSVESLRALVRRSRPVATAPATTLPTTPPATPGAPPVVPTTPDAGGLFDYGSRHDRREVSAISVPPTPVGGAGHDRPSQPGEYVRRVLELEAELRDARAEGSELRAQLSTVRDAMDVSEGRVANLEGQIADLQRAQEEIRKQLDRTEVERCQALRDLAEAAEQRDRAEASRARVALQLARSERRASTGPFRAATEGMRFENLRPVPAELVETDPPSRPRRSRSSHPGGAT